VEVIATLNTRKSSRTSKSRN